AYWPADDGNVPAALERAQTCARRLHARADAAAAPGMAPPAVHIGAGAGEIWAARLGDHARWQLLMAGPAVRQAFAAIALARPGETMVAAAAAGPGAVRAVSVPSTARGWIGSPPPTDLLSTDLVRIVPKRLQAYIGQGYSPWIAQRRTICALFVRITGL